MKIKTNQLQLEHIKNFIVVYFNVLYDFHSPKSKNHSEAVNKAAYKIEQKVIEWRHDIHQNPELEIVNFVQRHS
jgi:hypothetical protein